ncbi:MAG: hypothetical protein AAGA92_05895 [Planctomycetota bacterium]
MPRLFRVAARLRTAAAIASVVALSAAPALQARAQSANESKPLAVVGLSSFDSIVEDVNFLGGLAGNPMMGQLVQQMGVAFTQGMDTTKPVGVILQSDGVGFTGALCAPIGDLESYVETLAPFGVETSDEGNGVWKITANDKEMYATQAGEWALVSLMPDMLAGLPENPAELIEAVTDEYDIGVKVMMQNVPENYRAMATDTIKQAVEGSLQEPLPGESEADFEARKEQTMSQVEQIDQIFTDIDELTVGLAIDGGNNRAVFDFAYTVLEGTKLADQLALYEDSKTDFAGFIQPDAAMMLSLTQKMADTDKAQFKQMIPALRKQVRNAVENETELPTDEAREAMISAFDDFIDAFVATIDAGLMDGGAVLNLSPNAMSLVAGGFIGEPAKVEEGLKKIADIAKDEPDFPGVEWDAESHAGISFHTLSVPLPADEPEPRKFFGDAVDVAVGIGEKSVYFALGRDCLAKAKEVIDASAAAPGADVKPMELSFALGPILEVAAAFADGDDKETVQMISNVLNNESQGRDHVRLTSEVVGGNSVRGRLELEDGVLRAIGMGAMAAQMRQMEAQGF